MHQTQKSYSNRNHASSIPSANPKYYYGLVSLKFKRKRLLDEGVLVSMPWHHNYYHWLIEILPRLLIYDQCTDVQNVPLIVPKSAPRFVRETLRVTGYLSKTKFLDDGAYKFKKLYMLSMLAPTTEVSPDAIRWLNLKCKNILSTFTSPSRVYISRRDAKIRFVANETEVADFLAEYGFKTLVMSELPLEDQINVFRNADYIFGAHGAAFRKSCICQE